MDDMMTAASNLLEGGDHHLTQLRRLLTEYIVMIVDPRTILDFGF